MNPVFGLLSCYREGPLVRAAVDDLRRCCDRVLVLEGPVGETPEVGDPSVYWQGSKPPGNVVVRRGRWATDAAKRTELLQWAQSIHAGPAWGVTLDGDEVMPWAEYLPGYLYHADSRAETSGLKLKVCFEDGYVYESPARALRIDAVERYLIAAVQLLLKSGIVWPTPITPAEQPPLYGEPHVLHRGYLRSAERGDPQHRMSKLEVAEVFGVAERAGFSPHERLKLE